MSAFKISFAFIERNGYTTGYLVTWHIIVSKYSLPAFYLDKRSNTVHNQILKRLADGRNWVKRYQFQELIWLTCKLTRSTRFHVFRHVAILAQKPNNFFFPTVTCLFNPQVARRIRQYLSQCPNQHVTSSIGLSLKR